MHENGAFCRGGFSWGADKGFPFSCVSFADLVGFGEKPGWQNGEKFPSGFLAEAPRA